MCENDNTLFSNYIFYISDRIIVNGLSIQYTTALRIIVKQATTYLMEDDNGTLIVNFINNFHRLTYTAGKIGLIILLVRWG